MLFRLERYEFLRIISIRFDRSRFNVTIERNRNIRGERARFKRKQHYLRYNRVQCFFFFVIYINIKTY